MRHIAILFFALLGFGLMAQPANDLCSAAQVITPNGSCVSGTTLAAADNWTGTVGCQTAGGTHPDAWYSFVSTGNSYVGTVTTSGSWSGNVEFTLVSGDCVSGFTLIGDACGASPLSINIPGLNVGSTYYFTVSEKGNANAGPFQVCSSTPLAPIPANDDCSTPTSLGTLPAPATCGSGVQNGTAVVIAGTNVAATEESPYVSLSGCGMASPANSVWYRFVQPTRGYGVTINVSGGTLANPNIALWSGTTCSSLSGVNCIVGSGNAATLTVSNGMIPGQTYYIQISGNTGESGTYNLSVNAFQDCSDCLSASSLTVSPLPVNGMYDPGQTVSFCFHIDRWTQTVNNWLHGVQMAFGPGWDLTSLTTTPPAAYVSTSTFWGAVSPATCGNWAYYPAGTTSSASGVLWPAGFYFDGVYLTDFFGDVVGCGSLTGNPGNNFGDGVPSSGLIITPPANQWNFCWTIKVKSGCNPGLGLSVAVNTSGDGESGSWTSIGCSNDPTVNFTAQISCCPPTMSSTGTCAGLSNGTATATPDGLAGPYSYSWSAGGQNTQTITGLAAGTYTVTVIDANLCSATASVSVATNANPTVAPTASPTAICNGASTTLAANATAGSGSISTYAWSSGLAGSVSGGSVSPGSNTTYTVTVTNSNTCTATGSVSVTVNAKPTVAPTAAPATICNGASTTLAANATAGSGSISTYAWSSGLAGNVSGGSVSPTTNTTYTITVTNSNSCTATASVAVVVNAKPTVAPAAAPAAICNGGTTTLSANAVAGSGTISTYAWSSGLAGNVSGGSVSPTGNTTYTVTVTNSNSCTATGTVSVTVNANPTTAPTAAPAAICNGASTTLAVNATAGSGSISTYAWSSGLAGNVSGGSVSPTANTTYTVTVTNSNSCTATGSASVTVNANPTVAPNATPTGICNGGSTTLAANATAGSGSISTYAWSSGLAGNVSGGSVSPTTNTTYTVTVTNSNSCTATGSVVVTVNANPTVAPTGAPTAICNGASTTLAANATAGSGSISTYAWSSGLTGNVSGGSVSPTSNTTYTVTVTNSNSCTATGTVSVTVNANPTVAPTVAPGIICNGASTTLAANAVAGSGSISTYSWSSGLAGNVSGGSVSPTANTTYTVTVTNSNSCTATGTVSVVVNANPTVTPTAAPSAICNGSSTTLAANALAGSGTISTYAWSSGLAGNVSGGSVSPTANTTYNVTVTNSNSCTATGTVAVTVNANPTTAPTAAPTAICNGSSTTLAANAVAGSGSISTYAWSSGLAGNVSGGSVSPTGNTTYTVTITNSNSCTATGTVSITVNANPTVAPTASPAAICNGSSTTLAANATAGSGSISTYAWSSGLVGNVSGGSVSPTANTTYTVTVTNSNSCTATGTISVTVNANPTIAPTGTPSAICNGASTTLAANAVAGSGSISTYAWSSGLAGNLSGGSVSPTTNTTYTVTVTNSNSCTATGTVSVTVNANPTVVPTATPSTICSGGSTTLAANATAGSGSVSTYTWSSGLAGNVSGGSVSTTGNTTYTVTVTNSNSCTATGTVSVTVNANPTVAPTASPAAICNGSTTALAANATAGSGSISTYAWSSGLAGNVSGGSVSPTTNTTYTITVTNSNSCTATGTVSVTVNANPTVVPTATPSTICSGGSTTLAANATAGSGSISTYTWSSGLAGNVSGGSVSPTGNTTYTVTVTNSNSCTATGTVSLTVNATPTVAPTASPAAICNGSTTALAANATAGSGSISTYAWSSGLAGNVSGGSVSPIANTTYTVTVTNSNSCTATGTVSVTVNANPTAAPTAAPAAICNGASTTLAANAVAGSGSISTYAWSSGLAGNVSGGSISPTANTTYTVTVTNSNSCTATATISVVVNPLPSPTAGNTGPYCATATIQLSATGGTSYAWSGPGAFASATQNPTRANATLAMAGTYTVTVTDANGCTATATTSVVVNSSLTPVASNTGPYCVGGQVQLNVAGGNTYSWSGPNSFADNIQSPVINGATVSTGGTYSVTATDLNGCSGTASTIVAVNGNPTVAPTVAPTAICNGASTTLAANATAGSGSISTYSWSGGLAGNLSGGSVSPTTNTTYTVTVTNSNLCTVTGTVAVVVNANPTVAPTATPAVICNGGSTTLAANAAAGSGSISTYAWSSGLAGNISGGSVSPTTNTTYTVTVTNSNSCTATGTVSVTVNANPTVTPSAVPPAICNGQSTTLAANATAGSGSISTYTWSSGLAANSSGGSVSPTTNTTYTVTVTNSNSCTATGTVSVTVNVNPTAAPTAAPAAICNGASTTLAANATAGSGSISTYAWSSGLAGNVSGGSVSPTANTTYTVTVTNSNSCTATATVVVVVNANPTAAPTLAPATICNGQSTTLAANASAGSGSITTYSWSSGLIGNVAGGSVSPASNTTYTVTVTNTNNCTAAASAAVTVNPLPAPTAGNTGPYCVGNTIQLTSSGASAYAWSGPNSYSNATQNPTLANATTAMDGTYSVTVTDVNGCSATASTNITINALPLPAASNTGPYCVATNIQLNATGGTTYNWSGPLAFASGTQNPTTTGATLAMAGNYTVTVTDVNGCSATAVTAVVINNALSPVASNTGPYCAGATIQLNVIGGTGFTWSGPNSFSSSLQNPSLNTSTVAMGGLYSVTATDANGCSGTASTTVVVNALPLPSASNTGPYCAGVTVQLNAAGGTTYTWSGPNSYSNSTQNPSLAGAGAANNGTYSVTLTDANGCSASASTSVVVHALPIPSASNTGPYCSGETLQLNAAGGATYTWGGPNTFNSAAQNPIVANSTTAMAGVYTVTVTDVNSCSATASTTVIVNANPTAGPAALPATICNGASTTLSANAVAGSGSISTYTWSSGLAGNVSGGSVSPTANTTYTVTVTNSNSCSVSGSVAVTVNQLPQPTAANNGPLCVGAALQLSSSGGSSYAWSGPNAFSNASQNPAITNATTALTGTYNVTVTDVNGCSATAATNVVINNALVPAATNTGPYCPGATVQLNVVGGVLYSWSGPAGFSSAVQSPTLSNAATTMSGIYNVTATDANGCSGTASTSVTVNAAPVPVASNAGPFCQGTSVQLNSSGGSAYAWSGPVSYSSGLQNPAIGVATVAMSGVYTVTVTNAANCTATASTTVTVIPAMALATTAGNVSCNAGSNGTVSLVVSSGQSPYSFIWSNTATTQNITGVTAGAYTVTVTDNAGCTATASEVVSQPALLQITETHVNVLCSGAGTGSISISASGGTPAYTFVWNDGVTTQNRTNLIAGPYAVTVTDNNGCSSSVSISITEPPLLTATENHVNVLCNGAATGTITITTAGGTNPLSFLWNDGVITQNRSNLIAAGYTLTVTDNNACTASVSVTISEPGAQTVNETHTDVACGGATPGSINVTNSGGVAPYTYLWNDGGTTPVRTNVAAGNYSLTVTDNNVCTATIAIIINTGSGLAFNETHTNVLCFGGASGTITTTTTGGTSPYTYTWNDGITTQNRTNLVAGNYTVTVYDNTTCSISATINITEPTVLNVSIAHTNVACFGGNTGTITISPSGGTAPYSFVWNDGVILQNRTAMAAGNYSVTVSDNNSCTFSASATITEPNALSVTETHSDVLCNGGNTGAVNLAVSGGTSPYTYIWNDGSTLPNRVSLVAAGYSVTVTDNNLCSASASVTIAEPAALLTSETHANVLCNGGSNGSINTTVSGGVSPYTYLWSDAATLPDRVNLTAGNYGVTIQDNNNCSSVLNIAITEPTALLVSETHNNILCNAQNTGAINVTTSGATFPYTFNWNDGITIEDRANLSAGSYNLTVTDNNACSVSLSVSITEPTALVTTETHVDVACNGGSTGSIDVTVSGATAPYTYIWNDGIVTPDRVNIPSGNYSVTISDNNTCSASLAVAISSASGLSISETHTNATCNAFADAGINVVVTGGTLPYTYLWNDAVVTQNRSNIPAGNYSVSVTDNNGCVIALPVIITEPTALVTSETHTNILCNAQNTGSIDVTTTGATLPYTFNWNDGISTEDRANLSAGNYSLTVTDNNACSASLSVSVTEPTVLVTSETHINVACNGGLTGSIDVTVSGATAPYTYSWNDGVVTQDRTNIASGSYSVTISDNNACSASLAITINSASGLSISEMHTNATCNAFADAGINVVVTGGTQPYTFLWNDGVVTQSRSNITAGNYSLSVTDNNGCVITRQVIITEPTALSVTEVHSSVLCNGGNTGSINVTASGATQPYTYLWNDAVTTEDRVNVLAGNYSITVTDNNTCSASISASITEPAALILSEVHTDVLCNGGNTASINLTPAGGVSPYIYQWNDAVSTQDRNGIGAGNYSVTVADNNGCTGLLNVSIVQPAAVAVSETHGDILCNNGNNGWVNLSVAGGTTPYNFIWNIGATVEDPTNMIAGNYAVTVTDNNSCSASLSVALLQPTAIALAEAHTNVSCNGYSDGSISLNVSGGTPGYTYQWNDAVTSQNRFNLPAGNYTVTVMDINLCSAVTGAIITQPAGMALNSSFINPTCETNNADGSISLAVSGGSFPYTFNWSNGATSTSLTNLDAGNYQVTVTDGNTCSVSATFTLIYQYDFSVQATPSVTINIGENTTLGYTLNGAAGNYVSVWSPSYALDCIDCVSPVASPAVTTVYQIQVTNEAGCVATDDVTVYVVPDYSVFVPNVFTPNGDGNNDVFEIYGNLKGLAFLEVQIFNRWGEKVFESNNHHFKWDGTFKGVMQNPAVFVWQLKLSFLDGHKEELRKGSVTLLR